MTTAVKSVRDLRRQWKPCKERLGAIRSDHPTAVRFHRACSWLTQVEQLDMEQQPDLALIQQWIAFNALYGQWDARTREPIADRSRWKEFLQQILTVDRSDRISAVLVEHKRLVLAILENAYLHRYFWAELSENSQGHYSKGSRQAHGWYVEKRWLVIVEQLLERIYLLRCQVIHGASTYGSRLNRDALKHCSTMMKLLLLAILEVWIEAGADHEWGPLCYPPVSNGNHSHRQVRPR